MLCLHLSSKGARCILKNKPNTVAFGIWESFELGCALRVISRELRRVPNSPTGQVLEAGLDFSVQVD